MEHGRNCNRPPWSQVQGSGSPTLGLWLHAAQQLILYSLTGNYSLYLYLHPLNDSLSLSYGTDSFAVETGSN